MKKIGEIIKNYRDMKMLVFENQQEINVLKSLLAQKDDQIKEVVAKYTDFEESFMKNYYTFEYKYWQNKMMTNRFMYESFLNSKKEDYNKDFNPLVSIIIPVYNGANYLKYAIDSALNQTYKNIEIIVVNDGSSDNGESKKVAESYVSRIKYIEKENGGVSSALNVGIKNMNGEYFAWLSHDDIYFPNHIETNVEFLRYCKDKKTIPFSCFEFIDEEGKTKINETITAGIHIYDYKLTLYSHYACVLRGEVNGGNLLIPKEAFEKCGYFEEGNKITQEKDMWSRLLKEYSFINIPIITSAIRCHNKQVSNTSGNTMLETEKKLTEIINNITKEEMIRESGSVDKFYLDLYIHYHNNGFNELADEMLKRYNDCFK